MILNLSFLKENIPLDIKYFESIDSTSLYLKRCIRSGGKVPDLVIAGFQTNGQGRVGRSFYSPEQTGLYLTFAILADKIHCDDITPRVALCVSNAIDEVFGKKTGIKWVNDIYLNSRKISGVLCQRVDDYFLIGIGVNVEQPRFVPSELLDRFGSVTESCKPFLYSKLVLSLYQNLLICFQQEKSLVLESFRKKCVHINLPVEIEYDGEVICGVCTGIDDEFSLLLKVNEKNLTIRSGYMSLKI